MASDLDRATYVDGQNGRYQARLSEDWEIWGPNGGHLAAIAPTLSVRFAKAG